MCNETAMCYYEMVADILASQYFANSSWILKIEKNSVWKKGLVPTLRDLFKNLISLSEIFFKIYGFEKFRQAYLCFKIQKQFNSVFNFFIEASWSPTQRLFHKNS